MEKKHWRALALLFVCSAACSSSSSPTAPRPGEPTIVGVLGCSQTTTAWAGWLDTGDGRVWDLLQGYGGGDIAEWSRTIPNGGLLVTTRDQHREQPTGHRGLVADLRSRKGQRNVRRTATLFLPRSDDVSPGPSCTSARSPISSGPGPARSRTLTTPGGWSITSSQMAVPFADPYFRSCSTRGLSHPAETASAARVPRAAKPSAHHSEHSRGGESPKSRVRASANHAPSLRRLN